MLIDLLDNPTFETTSRVYVCAGDTASPSRFHPWL